jgi:hypothetical protein
MSSLGQDLRLFWPNNLVATRKAFRRGSGLKIRMPEWLRDLFDRRHGVDWMRVEVMHSLAVAHGPGSKGLPGHPANAQRSG